LLQLGASGVQKASRLCSLVELARELAKEFCNGKVSLEVHSAFTDQDSDNAFVDDIDGEAFFSMLRYYSCLSQAASCLAFVGGVCEAARDIIKNFKVRDDMLQCILAVDAAVLEATNLEDAIRGIGQSIGWKISPDDVKPWLTAAYDLNSNVKIALVKAFAPELSKHAAALDDFRPKFDAYINKDVYIKTQAKRHLLDKYNHEKLSDDTVALYNALKAFEVLRGKLGLPGALLEYAPEEMQHANAVFERAREAVTIVAHVNAIQGLTGADQKAMVSKLVEKNHEIPPPLAKELAKLHGVLTGAGAPPKKRARVS